MAEARLGVMTPVLGDDTRVDHSVTRLQVDLTSTGLVIFIPRPAYIARGIRKSARRAVNMVRTAFTPIPLTLVLGVAASFCTYVARAAPGAMVRTNQLSEFLWRVDSKMPWSRFFSSGARCAYMAGVSSVVALYTYAGAQRFLLRRLLSYHRWMGERKRISLKTKVWGFLLSNMFIRRIHRQLYAYQPCLPALPLPDLHATCEKYFRTVEPLLSEQEAATRREQMVKFLTGEGPRLQRWLRLKWLLTKNYVSDWWLQCVYLRSRGSLLIDSNYYGVDFATWIPSSNQAARAAVCVHNLMRVKRMIDLGNLDPQVVAKVVPLCMAQYEWIFSTTRVPCAEQDRLVHYEADESRHIVAIHRGYFYKVPTHDPRTKQQYTRYQMYYAFDAILNANEPPFMTEAEAQLPVLTTMNRDEWARVRQQYFINNPLNRKMIDIIDRAAFLINLDHEDVDGTLDAAARQYFVGTGVNRWCDKSFSIVVLKDGRTGMNGEHSWGDAPAMCHVIEIAGLMDIKEHPYHEDGLVKRTAEDDAFEARGGNSTTFCAPSRLHFVVPPALIKVIDEARTEVQTRIQDVKQKVLHFKGYGKKWVSRRAAVSPDAWLQMALQLAYYRDQGHFDQTYESSMTRFFLEGRTETIRSVSHESCAFVRAFEDPNVNAEQKYKLLTAACTQHQNYTTQAMIGEGVDRHLFTLYIASVVRKVDAPFLSAALSAKWKLSTSQIPPHQNPPESYEGVDVQGKYLTPSGGFGPVSDDGYGVCYNLHDNGIFFHVSSRIAPGNTDATRLAGRIEQAMLDMRAVMEPVMPAAPAK